jgi:hypothetical protein
LATDEPSCHDKIRSFGLKEELLPIKLNGRILRQLKSKKTEEEESQIQSDEDEMDVTEQQSDGTASFKKPFNYFILEHDDASTELSVEELEKKIIATNRILLSDPQTNVNLSTIFKLKKKFLRFSNSTNFLNLHSIVHQMRILFIRHCLSENSP